MGFIGRKKMKKFKVFFSVSVALLLMSVSGLLFAPPSDLGWRFGHSTIVARNLAPNWTTTLGEAATQYNAAGNLSFSWGPSHLDPPYSGHVAFQEVNFGASGLYGLAESYNVYGNLCHLGHCNTTNLKADFGHVKLGISANGAHAYFKRFVVLHEFGHILGMGHSSFCDSVMGPTDCWTVANNLTSIDQALIGSWYP